MNLNLVHDWLNCSSIDNLLNLLGIEVGHSNRSDKTLFKEMKTKLSRMGRQIKTITMKGAQNLNGYHTVTIKKV